MDTKKTSKSNYLIAYRSSCQGFYFCAYINHSDRQSMSEPETNKGSLFCVVVWIPPPPPKTVWSYSICLQHHPINVSSTIQWIIAVEFRIVCARDWYRSVPVVRIVIGVTMRHYIAEIRDIHVETYTIRLWVQFEKCAHDGKRVPQY